MLAYLNELLEVRLNACDSESGVLLLLVPDEEGHLANLDDVGMVEFLLINTRPVSPKTPYNGPQSANHTECVWCSRWACRIEVESLRAQSCLLLA